MCDTGIFRESSGSSSHSRTHCSYEQVARLVQRYYDCYHLGAQPSYAEALALSRAVDCGGAGHVCLEDFVLSFQAQCLAGALCALRAQATTYSSFFLRDLSGAAVGGVRCYAYTSIDLSAHTLPFLHIQWVPTRLHLSFGAYS